MSEMYLGTYTTTLNPQSVLRIKQAFVSIYPNARYVNIHASAPVGVYRTQQDAISMMNSGPVASSFAHVDADWWVSNPNIYQSVNLMMEVFG